MFQSTNVTTFVTTLSHARALSQAVILSSACHFSVSRALQKSDKLVKHDDRVERIGKLQKYPQYHCGMDAVKFALERCEGIFTNILPLWFG